MRTNKNVAVVLATMSATRCVLAVAACLLVTASASASIIAELDESFNDVSLVGSVPAGWVAKTRGGSSYAHWVEERIPGQYALHFRRGTTSSPGTAFFTDDLSGPGGTVAGGQIQDISGTVMIQKGRDSGDSSSSVGVHLRSAALAYDGNGEGYYVAVRLGTLGIWGAASLGASHTGLLPWASTELTRDGQPYTIEDDVAYQLAFSATGTNLSASLYTSGATPVLLGTLSYTAGTHEEDPGYLQAGYFGLRGVPENSSSDTWLWDLQAEVIPEPCMLSLMSMGGLAILRRRS